MWDVFICHASEDKDAVARPLAEALRDARIKVWYDEFTLTLGDSLRRSIERGIADSRFGVVILSPSFFQKEWPQHELDGLVSREIDGEKVILPVWHKISREEIMRYSPTLADKVAMSTNAGRGLVVKEILKVVGEGTTFEVRSDEPATVVALVEGPITLPRDLSREEFRSLSDWTEQTRGAAFESP